MDSRDKMDNLYSAPATDAVDPEYEPPLAPIRFSLNRWVYIGLVLASSAGAWFSGERVIANSANEAASNEFVWIALVVFLLAPALTFPLGTFALLLTWAVVVFELLNSHAGILFTCICYSSFGYLQWYVLLPYLAQRRKRIGLAARRIFIARIWRIVYVSAGLLATAVILATHLSAENPMESVVNFAVVVCLMAMTFPSGVMVLIPTIFTMEQGLTTFPEAAVLFTILALPLGYWQWFVFFPGLLRRLSVKPSPDLDV